MLRPVFRIDGSNIGLLGDLAAYGGKRRAINNQQPATLRYLSITTNAPDRLDVGDGD